MKLYVAQAGNTLGPYTETQLREYVRQGVFGPQDYAAPEGAPDWQPLAAVMQSIELRPARTATTAKQLPPLPRATSDRSRGVYIILGLFFGLLGVHNFYAGRLRVGAWQVIFFVLTAWTIVGALLELFFVIVELFTVTEDGKGNLLS